MYSIRILGGFGLPHPRVAPELLENRQNLAIFPVHPTPLKLSKRALILDTMPSLGAVYSVTAVIELCWFHRAIAK